MKIIQTWAPGPALGPGPGPLGVARRVGGGPDNGRAAEWGHGGPWAGPMGQGPWARAMGTGPKPIYRPC